MAKRDTYYDQAEHLYVVEQLTHQDISQRLPIGESTSRLWGKEGGWEEKRKDFLLSKEAFDKELFELAKDLSSSIRQDLKEKKNIAPSRFYTLARILEVIPKAKKYQEEAFPDNTNGDKGKTLEDVIKEINASLLGER